MAVPPLLVQAPAVIPARYGLQSAADQIAEAGRIHAGIQWDRPPCGPPTLDPALCGDDPTELDLPGGIGQDRAYPIKVFAGFTCSPVDLTEPMMRARAEAALATDWVAVESAVWSSTYLRLMRQVAEEDAVEGDPINTPVLAEDPVSITRGVGLLEAYLGASYAGVGVIHAPRAVAAHAAAAQLISTEPGRLTTVLGNRWAFGSGYPNTGPDGAPAATGTAWLVVTTAVSYRRTPVNHRRTREQSFDYGTNTIHAVADRTYIVSWDECVRAAVPVTLT
ncbi:hypothetical protein [Nocardia abscessus]|uniref:hypothetical protein n=1 Tax=Nocardia abscessus TaxID=120957 RepID=UPI0024581CCC|nr:hypothetical protein [Nocardia abscessus]